MRELVLVIGASALVSSCSLDAFTAGSTSRPFEVNIEPTVLHVGDTITVAYQYLGRDHQYRILFGDDQATSETMLELGEPTSDPGTFSFVLEPRMFDRKDRTRFVDVIPGRDCSIGFVGYHERKEFGARIGYLPVLPGNDP